MGQIDLIDSQTYNNYVLSSGKDKRGHTAYWGDSAKTYYSSNYDKSGIRTWLNEDFYNTAFSDNQKANIKTTLLNNDCRDTLNGYTGYGEYDANSTNDKIFLLSYDEATKIAYGFESSDSSRDVARQFKGSDYAKCQGLWVYKNSESECDGNSFWWLRSATSDSGRACVFNSDGSAYYKCGVNDSNRGVVPALNLQNLESDTAGSEIEEPSLSFGQDIYYLAVGETMSIVPKVSLSGSYSLIWKSNDPSIASVTRKTNTVSSALAESYGVVEAKAQGYTVLTATTTDGMYEARCLIYVGNKILFVSSDGEIEKNKVGTYNIGLVDRGGIIKDDAHGFALANYCHASNDELSDISFVIADPTVASLESVQKIDGYIRAKIKGLTAGTTYFTVTNRNTGEAKYVQIAIHDTECTYRADAMPKTTKKGGIFNFSKNSLRVYDFNQTVKSNGDRDVTFNVYSSASNVGSVDVYDGDGSLVNSFRVEPCTSNNPTSIEEHIGTAYNLVKMFVAGDPFGETQEIVSKKTEISTTIPANGYIKITNDIQSSNSCMIYNTVDVSIYLLEALAGTIIDVTEEEQSKEIKEKLSADLLWNIMRQLGIENEQSGAKTVMKHITGLTKELVKSADKLDEKNFLKLVDELCQECNIDFVDYLVTAVESVTKSAIKAGFKAAAKMNPGTEAAVKAFECMYKGAKWLNFGEMIIDINSYYMQGAAYIYNDQSGSVRISNGIRLEGAKSDEVVFRTYEITGGDVYESLSNNYQDSKLFDIALVKNNQVSQPDSTVKVFIPVPANWNSGNLKVYRINEDGTKTDMNAKAEFAGDYMVFTTNHFSYYALVMEKSATPTVNIKNYTANKTVDFKTTITFTAEVENAVSGATVHWFIDGQNVGTGEKYTVTKAKKSFTVQAKYIKDGKVLAESGVENVNVKTGFFAKLGAFFRSIFGALPKVVQGYRGVEIIEKFIP